MHSPDIRILAEGLFPGTVWVPTDAERYDRLDSWPYMIAAGNRCMMVGNSQEDGALCEVLDGAHTGIRFLQSAAKFL